MDPNALIGIVDRIGTKLVICNDSQLSNLLDSYIPKLLELLNFPNEQVRNKIVSVLSHVNKRIKEQHHISLPFAKILDIYLAPTKSSWTTNFTLIYLEMGFERNLKKQDLCPILFEKIHQLCQTPSLPLEQQKTLELLLRYFIDSLKTIPLKPLEQFAKREEYSFALDVFSHSNSDAQQQQEEDADSKMEDSSQLKEWEQQEQRTKQILLDFFKDCMLLKPNYSFSDIPKGLSITSLKRLVGNATGTAQQQQKLSANEIFQRQETVFHFLTESGAFDDNQMFIPILIGATETVDSVAMPCDNAIKKLDTNWEDPVLISQLFNLILGNKTLDQSPVSEQLKCKCMNYLCKSNLAANSFEQVKQVLNETLFSEFSSKKLKQFGYQLFVWSVSNGRQDTIIPFAKDMTNELLTCLQRVTSHGNSSNEMTEQKESIYLAVGMFASKFPQFFSEKLHLIELYLKMLHIEAPSTRITIQQSFNQLLNVFVNPPAQVEQQIIQLFIQIASHPQQSTTHALQSVLIACNKLFPFSHLPSRWICLLLCNHSHLQIREEALRGLSLDLFTRFKSFDLFQFDESKNQYPSFNAAISYFNNHLSNNSSWLIEHVNTHQQLLQFLTSCLQQTAKISNMSPKLYVQQICGKEVIEQFMNLILSALHEKSSADLMIQSCKSCLQLLTCHLEWLGGVYASLFVTNGSKCLIMGDETSKQWISKCMAVFLLFIPNNQQLIDEWSNQVLLQRSNAISNTNFYSYMVSLGYSISLLAKSNKVQLSSPLQQVLQMMVQLLSSKQHTLIFTSTLIAWREIAKMGQLEGLYPNQNIQQMILEPIQKELKKQTNEKMKEFIIETMGICCKGQMSWNAPVINQCFEYLDDKSQELQFSIGQTISMCMNGNVTSEEDDDEYNQLLHESFQLAQSNELVLRQELTVSILQRLIKEGVLTPKKIFKQSAMIWLSVIVEHCYPKLLKSFKKELAMAMAIGLLEGNDVTQEIAAKGLSTLYDLTTETQDKQELVSDIVELLSPSSAQQQVYEWKLFPKDYAKKQFVIHSSTSGSSESNYRELVEVAKQLQQPHLLFKLLSFSQQSTISLSKQRREDKDISLLGISSNQFNFILPKLYRYMYDPNELIQRTCSQLFRAMIQPNPLEKMETYFVPIFKELLSNLESNQWREREAACYGMGDLLSGKKLSQILPWIQELLYRSFKVTDDMRDSCRKAALGLVKKLGEFVVKGCSIQYVTQSKEIEASLQQVIPFFLEKGVHFPAKEMVFFSLDMLLKITEASKHFMRPYVADIVSQLLQHMSVLEPSVFNYLQTNPEHIPNMDMEQLDKLRVQMSSMGTPIPDTLQLCSRQVDAHVMDQLIPNLMDIIKNGIGVPTRAQTANFLVNLSKFHPELIKKYAFKLLRAILQAMQQSKSPAERNALSSSMPYLLLKTSSTNASKVMDQIIQLYVENVEQEELRVSCGTILLSIARNATNILQKFMEQIIPLICVAKFDESDKVSKVFVELWDMITEQNSSKQTLILYLDGIMSKALDLLNQSAWKLKRQGGQVIKHLAMEAKEEMPSTNRNKALQLVIENIPGRIWAGKESVLESMGYLMACFESNKTSTSQEELQLISRAYQLILKEIKREDWNYKMTAWNVLEVMISQPILTSVYSQEMYQQFKSAILEMLQAEEGEKDTKVSNHIKEAISVSCYKSNFRNFSSQHLPSEILWEQFEFLNTSLSKQQVTQTEIITLIDCLDIIWKQCRTISSQEVVSKILHASMNLLEFNSNPMNRNLQIREKVTSVWNANWSWVLSNRSREELLQWKELVQRVMNAEKDFHQKEQLTSLFSRVNQLC